MVASALLAQLRRLASPDSLVVSQLSVVPQRLSAPKTAPAPQTRFFCTPWHQIVQMQRDAGAPSAEAQRISREQSQSLFARQKHQQGFTLIELMIVMIVIGLLAAIAVPMYVQSIRNAREAVLKEDLRTMRSAIDSYTVDKQKAPQSLDDLVQAGYLKAMPVDPFTHRSDTWNPSQDDALMSLDQTESGITDVHSGAQGTAGDGSSYSSW